MLPWSNDFLWESSCRRARKLWLWQIAQRDESRRLSGKTWIFKIASVENLDAITHEQIELDDSQNDINDISLVSPNPRPTCLFSLPGGPIHPFTLGLPRYKVTFHSKIGICPELHLPSYIRLLPHSGRVVRTTSTLGSPSRGLSWTRKIAGRAGNVQRTRSAWWTCTTTRRAGR